VEKARLAKSEVVAGEFCSSTASAWICAD